MILDLCSEGTWTATSPHDTVKGVACETRSEPGVPGCRIDTKSRKNVFTRTHEHQKCYLAVLAFLLYEQYNNNFIFMCMNELEYELASFAGKGGYTNY